MDHRNTNLHLYKISLNVFAVLRGTRLTHFIPQRTPTFFFLFLNLLVKNAYYIVGETWVRRKEHDVLWDRSGWHHQLLIFRQHKDWDNTHRHTFQWIRLLDYICDASHWCQKIKRSTANWIRPAKLPPFFVCISACVKSYRTFLFHCLWSRRPPFAKLLWHRLHASEWVAPAALFWVHTWTNERIKEKNKERKKKVRKPHTQKERNN